MRLNRVLLRLESIGIIYLEIDRVGATVRLLKLQKNRIAGGAGGDRIV